MSTNYFIETANKLLIVTECDVIHAQRTHFQRDALLKSQRASYFYYKMINKKYRVAHFHIFKNAGTSIDRALKKHFGDRWGTFEGTHAHDIRKNEELLEYFAKNPDIEAVSSHLCRPSLKSTTVLPIVFIRHPLERAKSVYEFTKVDDTQPFRQSTTSSFSNYLEWALSKETLI
jgi:hypothetical protein